jgi:1-acyl-sn-glycerol-3-phosphate acyltransferase
MDTETKDTEQHSTVPEPRRRRPKQRSDRSWLHLAWYRLVQQVVLQIQLVSGGVRASGREHFPAEGGVLLISNHLSYYDVFILGLLLPRMLNYVARSTLFTPVLAPLIRSVGGFPIQRDGMGAQGLKETLKRLRSGSIVTFFPEGTRSRDGNLQPLKPGIAALASRAGVPIVAAGLAGTFESWPRGRLLPRAHAMRVHYGRPIDPSELEALQPDDIVRLLSERLAESIAIARDALARDLAFNRSDRLPLN